MGQRTIAPPLSAGFITVFGRVCRDLMAACLGWAKICFGGRLGCGAGLYCRTCRTSSHVFQKVGVVRVRWVPVAFGFEGMGDISSCGKPEVVP